MQVQNNPLDQLLAIVGPTASGKSSLSMLLVQAAAEHHITIEIISMDSALVYRGMNIGTAKPTPAELKRVTHHGINIRDPWEHYSAAAFAHDVKQWVQEIRARGNYPIVVGGTMLYWRALGQGLSQLPATTQEVRLRIESRAQLLGWDTLYRQLQEVDPMTAARLPPGDHQRISRALEVFELSGEPMSSLIQQEPYAISRNDANFEHVLVSLEPNNRAWLHERIEQRFTQMLTLGLIEEVKTLLTHPQINATLPAMRAVGYRQAISYLNQEYSYAQFVEAGLAASRQLAKRQLTWLRAMASRHVVDPSDQHAMAQTIHDCLDHIRKTR